jgi:hypothetical protein
MNCVNIPPASQKDAVISVTLGHKVLRKAEARGFSNVTFLLHILTPAT